MYIACIDALMSSPSAWVVVFSSLSFIYHFTIVHLPQWRGMRLRYTSMHYKHYTSTMTHNHAFMLTLPTSYSLDGRCRNHMEVV